MPTLDGWVDDLQQLLRTFPSDASVYGGRGNSADLGTAVAEQIHYLKTAQLLVRQDLIEWGPKAKDYLSGPEAGLYYKSLAAKFQQKFPDYDLPYMIEYGVYGLVQQELQNIQSSL